MSVKYIPVQWNRFKWYYDAVLLISVGACLWLFINVTPGVLSHERPIDPQVHNARAFGVCAFLMLSVILASGPLARLNDRFLPLVYNRRHFGVLACFVAMTHASYIINWYFNFSKSNKYEALLTANTSYGQVAGFPFETFGIFAIICLMILAFTSHDFWLKFLSPPVWKRLHYLIYIAYASVVAHIAWGILQDQRNHTLTAIILGSAMTVAGLHIAAALKERREKDPAAQAATDGWVRVCAADDIAEGRAKIARLSGEERVAVFRQDGKLSAISNACAHQNGPLGEGRVIDCFVTCPWHGFQYDVRTGQSPAPFTEKIPTYNIALRDGAVYVDPKANPPGTPVDPIPAEAT
jgi:nitrite reductase/ring-hydroxylating ferredoxin subunit/DMSO/TMAO reductase YedYZ heme-binding membrane subunit